MRDGFVRRLHLWMVIWSAWAVLAGGCSPGANKDLHLKRAVDYRRAQRLEEAAIEYMNVLRLEPTNQVAIRELALIFQEQGKTRQAYVFLHKARQNDPEDLQVRLEYGRSLYLARQLQEVRDEMNFILSKQPTNGQALILFAETAVATNEMAQTFTELETLRPIAGRQPGFHLALGTLHFRQGQTNQAETEYRQALALDPKSAEANIGLGNLSLLRKDIGQAEHYFKTAAELSPFRSPARLRYTDFKIRNGGTNEAKRMLEELTRQAPDYIPAWTQLAELAYGQKRYDDALELAKKILGRDNTNFEALMIMGRVKLAKGEAAGAVAEFERIATVFGKVPQVHYQLGMARLLSHDVNGALSSLSQAVELDPTLTEAVLIYSELNLRKGNPNAAIAALDRLIEERPNVPRAHLLLANAYLARGGKEDAMAVYQRMIALYPKNAEARFRSGLVLLQDEKTAEARKLFEEALELAPDSMAAAEQLVNLDLAAGQYQAALDRAQSYVDRDANSAQPLLLLARVHMARTNYPPAEAALTRAVSLDPNLRASYMLLAQIYFQSNRQKEAVEKLKSAVENNPKDLNALMLMGMVYDQMKDYTAARDAYERILQVNPSFGPALNNLAYLYSEHLGQLARAHEMAQAARELAPADPVTADTLGWILFKRGEYAWALSLIQESVENLRVPNAEVLYHLGMTHYMMSEEQPAREAFERARQLKTDFLGREDLDRRLAYLNLDPKTAPASAASEMEAALRSNPGDPVILSRLAAIYERDGDIPKTIQLWETALSQNAKNLNAMVQLTRLYAEKMNNPAKALDLAKQARNLAPEDARLAHMVGRLVIEAGDHPWALSLLQESARKLPTEPEVFYDLARSYYLVGRLEEARSTMEKALGLNSAFPYAAEARLFLAMIDLNMNPDKALAATAQVEAALASRPNFPPALMASALIQQQRGQAKEAKVGYEALLKRFPLFAPAHKQLAILLVDSFADYQSAFEHASKAREAYPKDPEVAKALGIIIYHRDDFNFASQLLIEACAKRPTDAYAFFFLGMAQSKLGQKPESSGSLRKALELNPNGVFAEEARRVLGR